MAVVKKWQVNTCKRDLSDGFITKVIYRLKAIENNIEIENTRQTGEVTFSDPDSSKNPNVSQLLINRAKEIYAFHQAKENGQS